MPDQRLGGQGVQEEPSKVPRRNRQIQITGQITGLTLEQLWFLARLC